MPGSAARVSVTIATVGDWSSPTIKSLSLLSRLALRTAASKLGDPGPPMQIMLIERGLAAYLKVNPEGSGWSG
jgi:hypothetical protein